MKVIFEPVDNQQLFSQLEQIAQRYNTQVRKHDIGEGHIIFVKSRIKITEKIRNNKHSIHVWGATEEDITFLKRFWGDPVQVLKEGLTPAQFADELADIPFAENLSKTDLLKTLDITDREYNQLERFIQRMVRRSNVSPEMKKASEILDKIN